jgi:hypothetical protein
VCNNEIQCNFECCFNCSQGKEYLVTISPTKHVPAGVIARCPSGHAMKLDTDRHIVRWECDECKQPGACLHYSCSMCNYDNCFACAEKRSMQNVSSSSVAKQSPPIASVSRNALTPTNRLPDGATVSCPNNHELCLDVARGEIRWSCDACKQLGSGLHYACSPCDYDNCFECAEKRSTQRATVNDISSISSGLLDSNSVNELLNRLVNFQPSLLNHQDPSLSLSTFADVQLLNIMQSCASIVQGCTKVLLERSNNNNNNNNNNNSSSSNNSNSNKDTNNLSAFTA